MYTYLSPSVAIVYGVCVCANDGMYNGNKQSHAPISKPRLYGFFLFLYLTIDKIVEIFYEYFPAQFFVARDQDVFTPLVQAAECKSHAEYITWNMREPCP